MSKRSNRVGNLIKVEISNMILFGEIKDPRLQGVYITNVKVSDDIGKATIMFGNSGNSDIENILSGFKKASGFIRKTLAKNLYLKRVPSLFFMYDDTMEQVEKIDMLLNKLHREDYQ